MNFRLQIIMISASFVFLSYIIIMVRGRKMGLKFALAWLFAGTCLLTTAIFPGSLKLISRLLNIIEPVNTLFLLVILFLMLILFTLTIALSRYANRVKTLTQEIGIIRMELNKLKETAQHREQKQGDH